MQIRSQEVGKKSLEKIYLNEYLRLYSSKMSWKIGSLMG